MTIILIMGGEMIFTQLKDDFDSKRLEPIVNEMLKDALETNYVSIIINDRYTRFDFDESYNIIFLHDSMEKNNPRGWMKPIVRVNSNLHARRMSYESKQWAHTWLTKMVSTFSNCFLLEYGDGFSGYNLEYDIYDEYDADNDLDDRDFTACSSTDCGMCGRCDY